MPADQDRLVLVPEDVDGALGHRPGVCRMTSSATATTGDSRMFITLAVR